MIWKILGAWLLLATTLLAQEIPTVNSPNSLRVPNYKGGSCVHASTGSAFNWCNYPDWQKWWNENYAYGESGEGLQSKLDRNGIRYASVSNADPAFLEWSMWTRRMVVIFYYPNHCVNLVHFDKDWAGLMDNNETNRIKWIPRQEFMRAWKGYGGFALTLVYDPVPPLPKGGPR